MDDEIDEAREREEFEGVQALGRALYNVIRLEALPAEHQIPPVMAHARRVLRRRKRIMALFHAGLKLGDARETERRSRREKKQ